MFFLSILISQMSSQVCRMVGSVALKPVCIQKETFSMNNMSFIVLNNKLMKLQSFISSTQWSPANSRCYMMKCFMIGQCWEYLTKQHGHACSERKRISDATLEQLTVIGGKKHETVNTLNKHPRRKVPDNTIQKMTKVMGKSQPQSCRYCGGKQYQERQQGKIVASQIIFSQCADYSHPRKHMQ